MTDITSSAIEKRNIVKLVKQGKVSDIFGFNGSIFRTSDRLSCFDHVILENVPLKGQMLNCISQNFKKLLEEKGFLTDNIDVQNYFYRAIGFGKFTNLRFGQILDMLPFEFIVRAYITGSAWEAYQKGKSYCGITFPKGLHKGDKLSHPVITITTKGEKDEPIDIPTAISILSEEFFYNNWFNFSDVSNCFESIDEAKETLTLLTDEDFEFANQIAVKQNSETRVFVEAALSHNCAKITIEDTCNATLQIFDILSDYCCKKGILLIDSKFEFGIDGESNIVLADEVCTPDSSRFCDEVDYEETGVICSMDKQIIRDYCKEHGFTGKEGENIPEIPNELVKQLTDTYIEIATRLFGEKKVKRYLN